VNIDRIGSRKLAEGLPLVSAPTWSTKWITAERPFRRLAERLKREKLIIVDTETVRLNPSMPWGDPKLQCVSLVQIGVPRTKEIFVVDVLALTRANNDLEPLVMQPLRPVLANPHIVKVIQYAPFEQAHFERSGIRLKGVHDTKAMARALYPDREKDGLNNSLIDLVRDLLGVRISKESSQSDWSRRPLSLIQKNYAELDAEIPFEVHAYMLEEFKEKGIDPAKLPWRDAPHHY